MKIRHDGIERIVIGANIDRELVKFLKGRNVSNVIEKALRMYFNETMGTEELGARKFDKYVESHRRMELSMKRMLDIVNWAKENLDLEPDEFYEKYSQNIYEGGE